MHSEPDTHHHDTPENDARLAHLLRADAPPERDPIFRMAILERRERLRYRRRMQALAFTAVVVPVLLVLLSRLQAGPFLSLLALLGFGTVLGACFHLMPAFARRIYGIGYRTVNAKNN